MKRRLRAIILYGEHKGWWAPLSACGPNRSQSNLQMHAIPFRQRPNLCDCMGADYRTVNPRCKPNLSGDAGLKSLIEGADRASCVHDIQGDGSRSRSPVASPCTPARRKSARHDHGTMLDTKLLVNQHTSAAILPSALFLCSLPAPRPLRLIRTSTTPAALMLLTLHVTGSR